MTAMVPPLTDDERLERLELIRERWRELRDLRRLGLR